MAHANRKIRQTIEKAFKENISMFRVSERTVDKINRENSQVLNKSRV